MAWSQNRFIRHDGTPVFVGLPTAKSVAPADVVGRGRVHLPHLGAEAPPAPSSTKAAIFAVFPLAGR